MPKGSSSTASLFKKVLGGKKESSQSPNSSSGPVSPQYHVQHAQSPTGSYYSQQGDPHRPQEYHQTQQFPQPQIPQPYGPSGQQYAFQYGPAHSHPYPQPNNSYPPPQPHPQNPYEHGHYDGHYAPVSSPPPPQNPPHSQHPQHPQHYSPQHPQHPQPYSPQHQQHVPTPAPYPTPLAPAASRGVERSQATLFLSHAESLVNRADYNGALNMYNKALLYHTASPVLLAGRSFAYMLSTPPNFDASLRDAEAAIQLDPVYYRGWLQQGEVRLRSGDMQGALDAYNVAVDCAHDEEERKAALWSLRHARSLLGQDDVSDYKEDPEHQPQDYQQGHGQYVGDQKGGYRHQLPAGPQSPQEQQSFAQQVDAALQQHHRQSSQSHYESPPPVQNPQPQSQQSSYQKPLPRQQVSEPDRSAPPPQSSRTNKTSPRPQQSPSSPSAQTGPPAAMAQFSPTSPAVAPPEGRRAKDHVNTGSPPSLESPQAPIPEQTHQPNGPVSQTPAFQQIASKRPSIAASSQALPSASRDASQHASREASRSPPPVPKLREPSQTRNSPRPSPPKQPSPKQAPSPQLSQPARQAPKSKSVSPRHGGLSPNIAQTSRNTSPGQSSNSSRESPSSKGNSTVAKTVPTVISPAASTNSKTVASPNGTSSPSHPPERPQRPAVVNREYDSMSVAKTAVSSIPYGLDKAVDSIFAYNDIEPRTSYGSMARDAAHTRLKALEDVLIRRSKGSLSFRPYTAAESIDAVKMFFVGITQTELTAREISTPTYAHESFKAMAVDPVNYPGNTFLDMDCESSGYYEGKWPGTVSITGYVEEYREHQLLSTPMTSVALEGTTVLPAAPLDRTVDRIRALQSLDDGEDADSLRQALGLSHFITLQPGAFPDPIRAERQSQIESICLCLNKSIADSPTRFVDFNKSRNVSNHTLGGLTQGIGLHSFLYQLLLGSELLMRLRNEPPNTGYDGLITDPISALIVLAGQWLRNVDINGPDPDSSTGGDPLSIPYSLSSRVEKKQMEGLICFAESMQWPLINEAKGFIQTAYQSLMNGELIGYDICDWLFGLMLPGKVFRHRIMCCLVYASPSIRGINPAAFFGDGLVVRNKSYWPKRSILGRVLGAYRKADSLCGWIGPLPAPVGVSEGWVRVASRRSPLPVPCDPKTDLLRAFGFEKPTDTPETTDQMINDMTDPGAWGIPEPAVRPANDGMGCELNEIRLMEVIPTSNTASPSTSPAIKEYRAKLEFRMGNGSASYTLYTTPLFVTPHPCIGKHAVHRRQEQQYLSSRVYVWQLRELFSESSKFLLIDAQCEGEELVARAWCAERGRHAVIRRGNDTCFACAAAMAESRSGLGFNVLIWAR